MRIIKIWVLGTRLTRLYESYDKQSTAQIIERLDTIAALLKKEPEKTKYESEQFKLQPKPQYKPQYKPQTKLQTKPQTKPQTRPQARPQARPAEEADI